jgi:Type I restriction modification DNA specificity domain.
MESWEEKTIKEVAKLRTGYAFNSREFSNDGYQVIRMGNLYNGMLDLQRNPVFMSPPPVLDFSIILKYLIRNGDILLTLTGTKYKRDYYAVLISENKNLLLKFR